MRGTQVKALRAKAKDDVLIATKKDNRLPKEGEVQTVYNARKKAYLTIRRGEPKPKLYESRRQRRLKKLDHSMPADRYRDRPVQKTGTAMRIPIKKLLFTEVVKKSFKKLFNSPKNKLIIEFLHVTGFRKKYERFAGIKTIDAAKKIIAKRQASNIKTATWWDAERKPVNLITPLK